jgi:hypothetical protein
MNLGELKTSFSTILNRRDCTTTQRDEFIEQGLAWAQRKLKGIPALRKTVTIETDAETQDGIDIPSDLIKLDTITVTSSDGTQWTLARRALDEVLADTLTVDLPRIFAQRAGQYVLAPVAIAGLTIRIDYFAELTDLVEDDDTNIASNIVPYLIVYAGLTYAGRSFTDKRRGEWQASRDEILGEVLDQAADDELSGGAAVSPACAWPSDK